MAYLIHLGTTIQYNVWSFEKQNQIERNINDISKQNTPFSRNVPSNNALMPQMIGMNPG